VILKGCEVFDVTARERISTEQVYCLRSDCCHEDEAVSGVVERIDALSPVVAASSVTVGKTGSYAP
jgi:hypothetical protein